MLSGQPLAGVSPPDAVDDAVVRAIRAAFVIGPERTPEQDVEFGIIELSDIAVKALSPGINDPTTAFLCIDRLSELVLALGRRRAPRPARTPDGHVHFIAQYPRFERTVGLAFDQIVHFGASNPAVAKRLLATLVRLAELVPRDRAAPIRGQADAVRRSADESLETTVARAGVDEADARLSGRGEPPE